MAGDSGRRTCLRTLSLILAGSRMCHDSTPILQSQGVVRAGCYAQATAITKPCIYLRDRPINIHFRPLFCGMGVGYAVRGSASPTFVGFLKNND